MGIDSKAFYAERLNHTGAEEDNRSHQSTHSHRSSKSSKREVSAARKRQIIKKYY
jgi:hypothetical protein